MKGGLSATTGGYTYTTNVRESNYPAWATGAAVAAWSAYYDVANHHDYLAPLAIAAGTNTIRPSEAVNSTDPAVAARWVDAGASNAWAPFDGLSNTYLQGYNSSNVLVSPATFTFSSQPVSYTHLMPDGCRHPNLTCRYYLTSAKWCPYLD